MKTSHRRALWAVLLLAVVVFLGLLWTRRAAERAVYRPASAARPPLMGAPQAANAPAAAAPAACTPLPAPTGSLRSIWSLVEQTAYARSVSPPEFAKSSGDVHIEMLGGTRYDFQAVGEFFALKSEPGGFEIQVRQQPFGSSRSISVATALAMNVAGDVVSIYSGSATPLHVNHKPVTIDGPVLRLGRGGEVQPLINGFLITWPSGSQVRVIFGGYLDYYLTLCSADQSAGGGILGSPVPADKAFVPRHGRPLQPSDAPAAFFDALYHVFGNSWRIAPGESLFDYERGQSAATFTDLNFPHEPDPGGGIAPAQRQNAEVICRKAGLSDPAPLQECILDVAVTGDAAFAENDALLEAMYAGARKSAPASGSIRVVAGTYGGNCQQSHGNKTQFLASACDGKPSCDYKIDYGVIGDPAVGCAKDYVAEWSCADDGAVHSVTVAPEAGYGGVAQLSCPAPGSAAAPAPQPVPSAPAGNPNDHVFVDLPPTPFEYYRAGGKFSIQAPRRWDAHIKAAAAGSAKLDRYWASGGYCYSAAIDWKRSSAAAVDPSGRPVPAGALPDGTTLVPVFDRTTGGKLNCFFGQSIPVDARHVIAIDAMYGSTRLGRWKVSATIPKIVPGPYYKPEK